MSRNASSGSLAGALRRHQNLVVGAALGALLLASLVALLRPRVFRAEAEIAITTQSRVAPDVFGQRVHGIAAEMRTAETLGRVIERAKLDAAFADLSEAEQIDRRTQLIQELIAHTDVKIRTARDTGSLVISHGSAQPERCAQVVTELVAIYQIDAREKPRQEAKATVDARTAEQQAAQAELDSLTAGLAAFEDENSELLGGAAEQLELIRGKIRELESTRISGLERELKRLQEEVALEPAFKTVEREGVDEVKKAEVVAKIQAVKAEITELLDLNQAAEDSPGVVSRRRSLAKLDLELQAVLADKRKIVEKVTNPLHAEIQKDLATKQGQLGIARRELKLANQAELSLLEKVKRTPEIQRERDALVAKVEAAELAVEDAGKSLARAQSALAGVEKGGILAFDTVRKAEMPTRPDGPHTLLLAAMGLLLGAAAGGTAALVRHRMDRSFSDVEAVASFLGVQTLGVVNSIETPASRAAERAETRRSRTILTALAVVSVIALAFALMGGPEAIQSLLGGGR